MHDINEILLIVALYTTKQASKQTNKQTNTNFIVFDFDLIGARTHDLRTRDKHAIHYTFTDACTSKIQLVSLTTIGLLRHTHGYLNIASR